MVPATAVATVRTMVLTVRMVPAMAVLVPAAVTMEMKMILV